MDEGYNGRYNDLMKRAMTGELFYLNNTMLLYSYPIELLRSFEDVYVLTYMFAAQTQRYYFDMKGLKYDYIGTRKSPDGGYIFTNGRRYLSTLDTLRKRYILWTVRR